MMNRTSRSIIHALALGLVTACPALGQGAPAEAPKTPEAQAPFTGPQLIFNADSVGWGTILDIEPTLVRFPFRNAGGADLKIGDIKTNCHCVTVVITDGKKVYKPGETGEIVVQVDPADWRGDVGTVVTVQSNSPGPAAELTAFGKVNRVVDVKPVILRMGWVKPGVDRTVRAQVIGRTSDFKVTSAKMTIRPDLFEVSIGEPEAVPGDPMLRQVYVSVSFKHKDGYTGDLSDRMELTTNDPRRKKFSLGFSGWTGTEPPPRDLPIPSMIVDGKPMTPDAVTPQTLRPNTGNPEPKPEIIVPPQAPAPAPEKPKGV